MGNLGSITNMLKKIGHKSIVTSDIEKILNAEKLILPGVGAFGNGMRNLNDLNLIEPLDRKVKKEKTPVLGICLGMHLMMNSSEEDGCSGLGWIEGDVEKFKDENLKIPHMGWNLIQHKKPSRLFSEIESEKRFYFVHSYYAEMSPYTVASCTYGTRFSAALPKDNFYATQFHPEKSGSIGAQSLKNFIAL